MCHGIFLLFQIISLAGIHWPHLRVVRRKGKLPGLHPVADLIKTTK
jgi:hypothetical protein